jgi:hypothetical protein
MCLRQCSRRRQALTAANRPGKPQIGHDELSAMATGAIMCWLTHDTYAVMRIDEEIERLGFTLEQVSTTFGVMAAKMLVEAAGTRANAIIVADRVSRQVSAREARRALGMDPVV